MSNLRSRLVKAEEQIALEARAEVIHISTLPDMQRRQRRPTRSGSLLMRISPIERLTILEA